MRNIVYCSFFYYQLKSYRRYYLFFFMLNIKFHIMAVENHIVTIHLCNVVLKKLDKMFLDELVNQHW